MDNEAEILAKSVLDWWETQCYQQIPVGDGDFDNLWNDTPKFVTLAQKLVPNYTPIGAER